MERGAKRRALAFGVYPIKTPSLSNTDVVILSPFLNLFVIRFARRRFEIPHEVNGEELKLSQLFGAFTAAKDNLGLQEYSLSQTSLEQIFNKFASQQEEEQGQVGI
jgi:hypothetical protein